MNRSLAVCPLTAIVALWAACAPAAPAPVVTNFYENLFPDAAGPVPVTFSQVGADGDFRNGMAPVVNGRAVPAQVDVLRRNADGSIRHALVSLVLPALPAGGEVQIDWLNAPPPAPPAFQWGLDVNQFAAKLVLTTAEGEVLTSDVGKLLHGKWTASASVKVLYDGPVMKEIEMHDVPVDAQGQADPELDIYWRLRAFTGAKSVRVEAVVERIKDRVKGRKIPVQYKFKGVELLAGDKPLFQEDAYDHLDQTRYRILVWTDGALEDIHRRPNYAYWVKGKFIPLYRWTKPMTADQVDRDYTKPSNNRPALKRRQGILENGIIDRHMPGTGGRWEMNPYPTWIPAYLMTGAPKLYRAILHADGNGAGAFFIHVRQDGQPGYNIFTVKQPVQDPGYRIDLYSLPDGTKTPVQPDHAHAPSLGYFSYLLTGDRYYAEELSFWASYQMGEFPHKGLNWQGMDRSFAWALRQTADAAFILPESDPLQGYFTQGVNQCLDEMTAKLVESGRHVHSPPVGGWKVSGRFYWVNGRECSPWMYGWVVWSLGNAVDRGFDKAKAVRDWAADYIVGFYTSEDEFKAPDGKVYRYDPKDAMCDQTATQLMEAKIVEGKDGKKDIEIGGKIKDLDNYGEVWYYTKLNKDNAWSSATGVTTAPDAHGNWPLRENGWGHGFTWDPLNKQWRWYNWHRYGAWVALVTAVEANVPNGRKAWDVMLPMASPQGEYDMEMIPRTGTVSAPAGK